MKTLLQSNTFRLSVFHSLLFLGIGFVLLHFGLTKYGLAFFCLLPVSLGMSIGALPNHKHSAWGLAFGLFVFMALLILTRFEGLVCVLILMPLFVFMLMIGILISRLLKKYLDKNGTDQMGALLAPIALFFLSVPIENGLTNGDKATIEVKSEILLPYSPEVVYDAIKSVDTLDAEKTILMKIGLPVPQKCELEREEAGALRTCYFEGGKIIEKITELERGKILKMDVVDFQLTGRRWIDFKEAIYLFEAVPGGKTKMTRITTYTSELKPRFYWEPFEKWGIGQEHEYVFRNLEKDLQRSSGF